MKIFERRETQQNIEFNHIAKGAAVFKAVNMKGKVPKNPETRGTVLI